MAGVQMNSFRMWMIGLLAPEKLLHGAALARKDNHEAHRLATYDAMLSKAVDLAWAGHDVELRCTNSGWVEFRSKPTPNTTGTLNMVAINENR
jgi:hypothetical protein